MNMFGAPQAISAAVASTLHTHGHTTTLDRTHASVRSYALRQKVAGAHTELPGDLPRRLTLIFDGRDRTTPSQVHLDRTPVPRRLWAYDSHTGVLSWNLRDGGNDLGGRLTVGHGGALLTGQFFQGLTEYAVDAILAPVSYICEVATDTGAFVEGSPPALRLRWDASSPKWKDAKWIKSSLLFTYQIVGEFNVGQWTYQIVSDFADEQTKNTWKPDKNSMACLLDANFNFTFALNGGLNPPPDDRSKLPGHEAEIKTLFPYLMSFNLTNQSLSLTGAMLINSASQAGMVLGVQGVYQNPSVAGLYLVSDSQGAPHAISVYDGQLHIGDAPVAQAHLRGNTLHFEGLTAEQQALSGLPAEGTLGFSDDGRSLHFGAGKIAGARVSVEHAAARLGAGLPRAAFAAAAGSSINLMTLLNMTQFKFQDNAWVDAVQSATMRDFNDVLVYYMPEDLRKTYYSSAPQNLPAWLQKIATMGDKPQEWYQSLAVSFLTNVMHNWSEKGAENLNALRAQSWLKSQTALSKVFEVQSAAMYAHEWYQLPQNTTLPEFLADQQKNKAAYAKFIGDDAVQWIAQLTKTIVDPDQLASMKKMVNQLSAYAQSGYYWAYTFFRAITNPAALNTIMMISLGHGTDLDGSAFMRQVQTNVAVLAQLDPSSMFAQQYVQVIQIFQLSNMLPTLLDYSGNAEDYIFALDGILKQIIKQYQKSSDPDLQKAAAEAEAMIAKGQLNDVVMLIQASVAGTVGIYTWEQVAAKMQSAAGKIVGTIGANLVCLALGAAGIMGLVFGTLSWSKLSTAQQIQVATAAAAFTIQAFGTIAKQGVAIAAVWDTSATLWSNVSSIFKDIIGGKLMGKAQGSMQNGFGKWLVGKSGAPVGGEVAALLAREGAEAEATLVTKVFGRNLGEFLATRLAAVVSVINLVISIIMAVKTPTGLEGAANWLIVSSALLDVVALVGGWALSAFGVVQIGGMAVATICSVLSFLAILAAVAGVAILLYLAFRPQKNPVEVFGEQYARPAGLYMPYGWEIDYFNGYVQKGELNRLGLSFSAQGHSSVLVLQPNGEVREGDADYNYDTVFFASVNASGRVVLNGIASDGKGGAKGLVLTDMGDGTARFADPPDSDTPTPDKQLWNMVLQAKPEMDGQFPSVGAFHITGVASNKTLFWDGKRLALEDKQGQNWAVRQQPMAVAGVAMEELDLYTFSKGQTYRPSVKQPGSVPQVWTVAPALPKFLTFDAATGAIATWTGEDLPITPKTKYELSASNAIMKAPQTAAFAIEVQEFDL